MSVRFILTVSVVGLLTIGCKFEGGVYDAIESITKSSRDFMNSKITKSSGVADGQTVLSIPVQFVNSDGTVIKSFQPTYEASMSGLTVLGCSVSDASGRSVCQFKSTQSGDFTLKFTNTAGKVLEETISFLPPAMKSLVGQAAGADQNQSGAGGWTSKGAVGTTGSTSVLTGSGGWKVFIDVQPTVSEL